jgi:hypothetical protein
MEEVTAAMREAAEMREESAPETAHLEELEKVPADDPDYEEACRERLRRLGRLAEDEPVVFRDDEEFAREEPNTNVWYAKCVGLRLEASRVAVTLEGGTYFDESDSIRIEISAPCKRASASSYQIGATYRISVSEDR